MKTLIVSESFIFITALTTLCQRTFQQSEIEIIKSFNELEKEINTYNLIIADIEEIPENLNIQPESIDMQNDKAKIIIYNKSKNENICIYAVKNGVDAYITKIDGDCEFLYITNKVLNGGKFYDPEVIEKAVNKKNHKDLKKVTSREEQVIKEIRKGYSNKEISEKLGVSECTVKKHITNILAKLNLKNRQDIIKN